jgi:iron complex outermembrane receptor protein
MNPLNRSLDNLTAGPRRLPPAAALQLALLGAAFAAASAGAQEPAPPAGSAPPPATQEPVKEEPAKPAVPVTSTLPTVSVKGRVEESATGPVQGYVAKRSATATKTDTPLIETPQSISVITADRVEAIGATTLRDAMGYTPGINIAPWGTDARYDNWIFMRGFDAYKPGFNLDGLPLRNAETWGLFQTENYGSERIEVLRGPASVLYGQGGPGGTVNVVSKRPQAEAQREVRLQVSDPERHQVMGDFTGPLSEDGSVLYRVTALVREGKSNQDFLPDDRLFIAPSLTWTVSPDTTVTFLSHVLHYNTGTPGGLPEVGTLLPNPNGQLSSKVFPGEPGFDHFDHEQQAVGYLLEHRANADWTLRQNLRYARLKLDYQHITSSAFVADDDDDVDADDLRVVSRNVFASREEVSSISLDNQAQTQFVSGSTRHTLLVGLDHQRSQFDVAAGFGFRSGPTLDLYNPVYGASVTRPDPTFINTDLTLKQTGLYVQDQIKFGERWSATLGTRYDSATTDGINRLPNGAPVQRTDREMSNRAGLVYLNPNGWAPYVSYSESFSPSTTLDTATGRPFSPETGRQYEAGARYQPLDSTDSYSVAVFDLVRRDYLTSDAITFESRQTGEIKVQGVELEASLRPRSDVNVIASYTFTPKADVTASSTPEEIGKQLNPVPRHQASVWGDYRFAPGTKAGLGLRYVGSHRGVNETAGIFSIGASVPLPSYTLVDALVSHDIGLWNLALNVRNLADKEYLTTCSFGTCYFGDERRTTVTATYRW